ncbi:MAG TPA: hypothetical protein VNT03_20660, partial [Baekduia sp.]|nr:hypothetical protein [Baekduia sp.]
FGLGTVPELRSWGSAGSEQRLARIWNPAEFACFDPVPDELATPAFREAVRMTAQAWGDEAAAKVRRICVGAAKQLSKPAADVIQRPARSFVVFAADLDADDADPAVRRTVPASTRRTLEQLADEATPPPDPAASRGGGR